MVTAGSLMSVTVPSVIDVHDGMGAPIGVEAFVIVEASEPDIVAPNPDMVRPEIDIRAAHEADKFDAVPNIVIRDEDYAGIRHNNRRRCWSDYDRRRRDDNRLECDTSVRRNDTAGN